MIRNAHPKQVKKAINKAVISGSGGSSAQASSKKVGLIGLVGIVISAMIGGGTRGPD